MFLLALLDNFDGAGAFVGRGGRSALFIHVQIENSRRNPFSGRKRIIVHDPKRRNTTENDRDTRSAEPVSVHDEIRAYTGNIYIYRKWHCR